MYIFLLDRRSVQEREFAYWERLIPELQQSHILGTVREIESDTEATYLLTDVIRKKKFQTAVAVGNDAFLASVAGATLDSNLVIGYIPLGLSTDSARTLGISSQVGEVAASLAARRFRTLDLLKIHRLYAVSSLQVHTLRPEASTSSDQPAVPSNPFRTLLSRLLRYRRASAFPIQIDLPTYNLSLSVIGSAIFNISGKPAHGRSASIIDPEDGLFNCIALPAGSRLKLSDPESLIEDTIARSSQSITHLRIPDCYVTLPEPQTVIIDGIERKLPPKFFVQILPRAFKLII